MGYPEMDGIDGIRCAGSDDSVQRWTIPNIWLRTNAHIVVGGHWLREGIVEPRSANLCYRLTPAATTELRVLTSVRYGAGVETTVHAKLHRVILIRHNVTALAMMRYLQILHVLREHLVLLCQLFILSLYLVHSDEQSPKSVAKPENILNHTLLLDS